VTLDPISLTRTLDVTSSNAWWAIYAGRGDDRVGDYRVEALVNDEVIQDMTGSSIDTRDLQAIRTAGGVWNLGPYAGNRVKLEVRITPTSYPGYELPSFYLDQLEVGPETARVASPPVAASLVGTWRLRGGKSALKKSYHNGLLSGGDGVLRLYSEGTVSTWLRLPSGIQKSGVGYLLNDPDGVVFDYVNGDWVRDKAQLSDDEQTLWVREEGDEESWSLVFTRSELSAFPDFAGSWELRASESKIHNNIHSGNMQNGAGRLSVGRDGAYSLRIQYPPDAEGRTKHTSATGQVVMQGGRPVFDFDDEAWTDDHGELTADKGRLTLREKGNGDQWTLVFSK
jgi:hypothetical protein